MLYSDISQGHPFLTKHFRQRMIACKQSRDRCLGAPVIVDGKIEHQLHWAAAIIVELSQIKSEG